MADREMKRHIRQGLKTEDLSLVASIETREIEAGLRARATGVYDHLSMDELYRRQRILWDCDGELPAEGSHPYDARLYHAGAWQDVVCPQCDGRHVLPGSDGSPQDCPLCNGHGVCHINEAQAFLDAAALHEPRENTDD